MRWRTRGRVGERKIGSRPSWLILFSPRKWDMVSPYVHLPQLTSEKASSSVEIMREWWRAVLLVSPWQVHSHSRRWKSFSSCTDSFRISGEMAEINAQIQMELSCLLKASSISERMNQRVKRCNRVQVTRLTAKRFLKGRVCSHTDLVTLNTNCRSKKKNAIVMRLQFYIHENVCCSFL